LTIIFVNTTEIFVKAAPGLLSSSVSAATSPASWNRGTAQGPVKIPYEYLLAVARKPVI
jgi:hypothetical protein